MATEYVRLLEDCRSDDGRGVADGGPLAGQVCQVVWQSVSGGCIEVLDSKGERWGLAASHGDAWEPADPPSTAGEKHDDGKRDYTLLPVNALGKVVDVLDYGARKYPAADNWKYVDDAENRYLRAVYRHLEAFRAGEILDPESGLDHRAHAITSLLFLLEGFE